VKTIIYNVRFIDGRTKTRHGFKKVHTGDDELINRVCVESVRRDCEASCVWLICGGFLDLVLMWRLFLVSVLVWRYAMVSVLFGYLRKKYVRDVRFLDVVKCVCLLRCVGEKVYVCV